MQVADPDGTLAEVEALLNPQGRLNDRELISDAHPRFRGTSGPGSDRQEMPAVEHEVELFAKRIGEYLEKARSDRRYESLVLIAPPKFLGALRRELGKEVQKLVADELPKDLSGLSARELEGHLRKT